MHVAICQPDPMAIFFSSLTQAMQKRKFCLMPKNDQFTALNSAYSCCKTKIDVRHDRNQSEVVISIEKVSNEAASIILRNFPDIFYMNSDEEKLVIHISTQSDATQDIDMLSNILTRAYHIAVSAQ